METGAGQKGEEIVSVEGRRNDFVDGRQRAVRRSRCGGRGVRRQDGLRKVGGKKGEDDKGPLRETNIAKERGSEASAVPYGARWGGAVQGRCGFRET